jgi:hypothetical protein
MNIAVMPLEIVVVLKNTEMAPGICLITPLPSYQQHLRCAHTMITVVSHKLATVSNLVMNIQQQ